MATSLLMKACFAVDPTTRQRLPGHMNGSFVVYSNVHIKSRFILNGVCAKWRGWIDLDRLDGVGCVEFDEEAARIEDVYRREQVERFNQRLREFEEDQRAYRNHHVAAAVERQSQSEHNPDLVDARKKMDLSAGHAPH
ncbi:hypothetical protein OUZ56_004862 [Daphnia magna]|uniref:Protein big brother n=1 Tax=Daphnia magna TaxID=35525 RepID=A0ABQ9YR34_9CRUS|nr:hypothetical protein OUZ56_004862 [Daphnia magna]